VPGAREIICIAATRKKRRAMSTPLVTAGPGEEREGERLQLETAGLQLALAFALTSVRS